VAAEWLETYLDLDLVLTSTLPLLHEQFVSASDGKLEHLVHVRTGLDQLE
jgi:hypothetical protein